MNAIRSFGRRQAFQALGDASSAPPDDPPPVQSVPDTRTWWEHQDGLSRAFIYWAAGTLGSAVVGGVIGNRVMPEHRVLGTVAGVATGTVVGFAGGLAILEWQPRGQGSGYK